MTKSQRPQVFIEKIMPVKLLNEHYEHGGNPFKGLHRWYSRKPLSFSRASVLASLLPADISMEEFEYLLGLHPEKEGININRKEAIKLYKTPPSSLVIEKIEAYCEKLWGKRKPVVLDAFAGGGSIPFEAARYGLNVLASDLSPVAVVTMKAAMEFPLNDMLMKTLEIAFKVIPKSAKEHKMLTSLWLSMDEIKAKVVYEQTKLF